MPSALVRGPYPSVNTSFDPPYFLLDTTFNTTMISYDANFNYKIKEDTLQVTVTPR
jgi:hypothetical protein